MGKMQQTMSEHVLLHGGRSIVSACMHACVCVCMYVYTHVCWVRIMLCACIYVCVYICACEVGYLNDVVVEERVERVADEIQQSASRDLALHGKKMLLSG